MNQSQISQIQLQIDRYFQLDVSGLISKSYPDVDQNSAAIGEYTTKEFLSLSNKIFNQFREELKGLYFKSLPHQYHFHNEYGGGDLNSDLTQFNSFLESNHFQNSIVHMNRLVQYQAVNGFWEKTKRKYFRHSEESLNSEKERIELVSKQLKESTDALKSLLKTVEEEKDNLAQFTAVKRKELGEIESLLSSSRSHNSEITELHTSATSIFEKISALLDSSDLKRNESDALYKESKNFLKEIDESLREQKDVIAKQNKIFSELKLSFDEKLTFVKGKMEYFSDRNKYLDDLIGREVGVSLFATFKQRKGEIGLAIGFWKWSVPITAIATIAWIFFLFGNGDLSNLSWQVIVINSLKALPAIGLLLFSISQYTKERNFQEEYAFKSAVALTLNSYADQLKDEVTIQRKFQ